MQANKWEPFPTLANPPTRGAGGGESKDQIPKLLWEFSNGVVADPGSPYEGWEIEDGS